MPIYSQHYPDDNGKTNTVGSQTQLAVHGPTVPVAISLTPAMLALYQSAGIPVPSPVAGLALIDTGASVCVIDQDALGGLGITPSGAMQISTASGSGIQPTYAGSLSFPGTTLPNVSFTDFVGASLREHGIVALIGRSVLQHFVVIYNGPAGSVTLAY